MTTTQADGPPTNDRRALESLYLEGRERIIGLLDGLLKIGAP